MSRTLSSIFMLSAVMLIVLPNSSAAQQPTLQTELSRLLNNQGSLETLPQLLNQVMGIINSRQRSGRQFGHPIFSSRPYGAVYSDGSYRYFVGPGWPTPPGVIYMPVTKAAPSASPPLATAVPTASYKAVTNTKIKSIYTPAVEPESIAELSKEACLMYSDQTIDQGICYFRQGEIDLARQHFQEATVLTPNRAAAWGLCGIVATAQMANDDAIECAKRVRELLSDNPSERAAFYRRVAPIQGAARGNFEQLVRRTCATRPTDEVVAVP